MSPDKNILLELYKKLLLARVFEERVYQLVIDGVVLGSVHLSTGEEAAAVGTIAALKKEDYILPTHRGHAQVLAKGADPAKMLAELCGKETGYSKGISGSIHLFDKENNNLGSNGIVGAQFPIAVGAGIALKYKKSNNVIACFFGDGSSNQGWFYELLNLASLWTLPIVLVCVNNLYGMGMHYSKTSPIKVSEKAKAFKIKSVTTDGNDVWKVFNKMTEIVKFVRKHNKPALIECLTYRHMGHSAHDQRPYRPADEINYWKERDPLKITYDQLVGAGILPELLAKMKKDAIEIIKNAEEFARKSKFPVFYDSMQL